MLHRIRETAKAQTLPFEGTVEVDETYIDGLEKNKHHSKKLKAGRGTVGKVAVVGAGERETGKIKGKVVAKTDREALHV